MKKIEYFMQYAVLRTLDAVLCALPLSWALKMGEWLGVLMSAILKKRRRLIIENLTWAFPEKAPEEIQSIARKNWRNLGRTALEFVRSQDYLSPENYKRIHWVGIERLDALSLAHKPAIIIVFHFTNWEILGMATQLRFRRIMAIARPMKNPYVDRWIQHKRANDGMKITLHRNAVKESLRWLKHDNIVGLLVDQNLYHGGVFVNFFGRPAATTTLPALLHLRTDAPVFISFALREKDTFRFEYVPVVMPVIEKDEDRVVAYTQVINDYVESVVRKYPENWFWIHNRWKRKPEPAPAA